MNDIKHHLYDFCKAFVDNRIARIQKNIKDIQESLTSETKSSAGDKHETGRAMLQLEGEKLGQQLAEAEKVRHVLAKVSIENTLTTVGPGSLVRTSKATYFLSISAGECKYGSESVFCISAVTPIGQLLFGKPQGDSIFFNGEEIKICSIK